METSEWKPSAVARLSTRRHGVAVIPMPWPAPGAVLIWDILVNSPLVGQHHHGLGRNLARNHGCRNRGPSRSVQSMTLFALAPTTSGPPSTASLLGMLFLKDLSSVIPYYENFVVFDAQLVTAPCAPHCRDSPFRGAPETPCFAVTATVGPGPGGSRPA